MRQTLDVATNRDDDGDGDAPQITRIASSPDQYLDLIKSFNSEWQKADDAAFRQARNPFIARFANGFQ